MSLKIAIVPILRSGLAMTEGKIFLLTVGVADFLVAFLAMFPEASVYHLGIFREEKSLQPVVYYEKLPKKYDYDVCLVLDPVVATAGTAISSIHMLKECGASRIHFISLVGSQQGVKALMAAHPDVHVHVAAIDEQLDTNGAIIPGLGDAGDRIFGLNS